MTRWVLQSRRITLKQKQMYKESAPLYGQLLKMDILSVLFLQIEGFVTLLRQY